MTSVKNTVWLEYLKHFKIVYGSHRNEMFELIRPAFIMLSETQAYINIRNAFIIAHRKLTRGVVRKTRAKQPARVKDALGKTLSRTYDAYQFLSWVSMALNNINY